MQKAILCFRDYKGKDLISGISNGQNVTSHKNLNGANDFCGRGPADRVDLLAPYDCKVVAIARADNTVLFESLDIVQMPCGYDKCWFLCTHMTDGDFNKLGIKLGKVFRQGEPCYTEGPKNAYGINMDNHIHMEQGTGRWNGNASPYYKSNDTYTYAGKTYNTYYPNVNGYELPITDSFFLPEGVEVVQGPSDVAKNYKWKIADSTNTGDIVTIAANTTRIEYKELNVYVSKVSKKNDIKGSVDGNKYGVEYDKTIAAGFSDKELLKHGYREVFATNGSTFYTFEGATFAEGIEISKGVNNQDYNMSCVSKFGDCMALGFPKHGGIVFDYQKNLEARNDLYGAVTGAFGIMKDSKLNIAGSEHNRGNCFTNRSGRTIWAEDNEFIYTICFKGVTGQSGLTGAELYELVKMVSNTMVNAICFDGGGSVFDRVNGSYLISTDRKVKNAVMLFARERAQEPDEKPCEECEALRSKIEELTQKNESLMIENNNLRDENLMLTNKLKRIKEITED